MKLAFSVQPFKVLENPITQVRALARNRKRVKGVNASHWFVGDERIPLVYLHQFAIGIWSIPLLFENT